MSGARGLFDGHMGLTLADCLKGSFPHFTAVAYGGPSVRSAAWGLPVGKERDMGAFLAVSQGPLGAGRGAVLRNTKRSSTSYLVEAG